MLRRMGWLATLAVLCGFMLLPLLWAGVSSLKTLEEVYAYPPRLTLSDPQWSNYGQAFSRLPLLRFLGNSLVITGVSVAGAVLTSSMAGFALARLSFRGRRLCFGLVLVSMLIPAQILLVPRFLMYDVLGWVNTYKPLIVPACLGGGAFNVFLFHQFFRSIPTDMDDAAMLDGASAWQTYWHVILPMARPATITVVLVSFVYHWQDFIDPLIYLSDFQTYPIALGLRMFQSQAGTWANVLMAASLVALVPVAVVFLLCERYVMRGLGLLGGPIET